MAKARQSKSDFAARTAQNKGVKHGTTRMGKGGRASRSWNAKTARWEIASAPLNIKPHKAPVTSNGAARASHATGTFTPSYSRTNRPAAQASVSDILSIANQRNRETIRGKTASNISKYPHLASKRKSYGLTAKYSSKGLR